ncbi:hypothetical protein BGZ47_002041 [Haplosporangium gracile]|nr:hypothetical protein BGZ47_002041 [Haplosporangium gracile]
MLSGRGTRIDRIFNNEMYTLDNCILIEMGTNFGKSRMAQFQSNGSFAGCKIIYGIMSMRKITLDSLVESKEFREQ